MLHRFIYMHYLRRVIRSAAAGAAGLAVMELVRRKTMSWVKERPPSAMDVFASERAMTPFGTHHGPDESATDALGRILYEKITGKSPSKTTKAKLSWAVHIGYGMVVATLFANTRRCPRVLRDGALFGAGLWLLGDELAVPALGLSDKPTVFSPSHHAQSFAQHIGFGVATAAATRAMEVVS